MWPDLVRAGFALGIVILLILILGAVLRRFGQGGTLRAGKRLAIVESLAIDPRRRLVLVRRDEEEHLLLLGPGGDLVVGSGGREQPQPATPPGEP
ncbi:MAG: flagellar biosynthetic protein FliO [Zavarzinia sp.]|nr:flagellar biosynthetic protein FliO [Zavarzinia sp.]